MLAFMVVVLFHDDRFIVAVVAVVVKSIVVVFDDHGTWCSVVFKINVVLDLGVLVVIVPTSGRHCRNVFSREFYDFGRKSEKGNLFVDRCLSLVVNTFAGYQEKAVRLLTCCHE